MTWTLTFKIGKLWEQRCAGARAPHSWDHGGWKSIRQKGLIFWGGGGIGGAPLDSNDAFSVYLAGETSNIFCFHPENWGRWTHFDYIIFFRWGWFFSTNDLCFDWISADCWRCRISLTLFNSRKAADLLLYGWQNIQNSQWTSHQFSCRENHMLGCQVASQGVPLGISGSPF